MIKGELLGGEELKLRAGRWGPNLQSGLAATIGRLVLMLQRNVKQDKLSGSPLRVKTGRLRRSINARTDGMDGTKPEGTVGTNVKYARAHEYGFHGTVAVKAHLRTIKQAFGKSITPVTVNVAGSSRTMNLPERSFLRTALKEMEPIIKAETGQFVEKAIK